MGELADLLATWPVGITALGVATAAGAVEVAGEGAVPRPWASVTKTLTTYAVLVAVEEGTMALDDPAGPPGATVRHLLAHASGLPLDGTVPVAAPAARRIYSNTGIEIAADLLAVRAAMPFAAYLRDAVLDPLSMVSTVFEGSAASGARGPLEDLVRFAAELVGPRLLAPATLAEATTVQFPGLAGVVPGYGRQVPNDWGLGFELHGAKQPHWMGSTCGPGAFGHFGRSGSMLWVDPVAGVACASLADRPFGDWAKAAWPALSDAVLARHLAA